MMRFTELAVQLRRHLAGTRISRNPMRSEKTVLRQISHHTKYIEYKTTTYIILRFWKRYQAEQSVAAERQRNYRHGFVTVLDEVSWSLIADVWRTAVHPWFAEPQKKGGGASTTKKNGGPFKAAV